MARAGVDMSEEHLREVSWRLPKELGYHNNQTILFTSPVFAFSISYKILSYKNPVSCQLVVGPAGSAMQRLDGRAGRVEERIASMLGLPLPPGSRVDGKACAAVVALVKPLIESSAFTETS